MTRSYGPVSVVGRRNQQPTPARCWDHELVSRKAGRAPAGAVELRGWQTADASWWVQITLLGSVAVGASVLLGRSVLLGTAPADTLVFLGCFLLAGAIGVGLFIRHRVTVDELGVAVRWLRTRSIPWTEIAALRVVRTERAARFVVVVGPTSPATAIGRPRDPQAFVDACSRLRPAGRGPTASPAVAARVEPRPVAVIASPWSWSVGAGAAVVLMILAVEITVSGSMSGWLEWPALLLPLECAVMVGMILGFYPQTRTSLWADATTFSFVHRSTVRSVPMREIDRFLEVEGRSIGSTRSLALLVGHETLGVPVPRGRGEAQRAKLVARLEALRSAVPGDERSGIGPDDRRSFDPMFRPPWIPIRPFDALIPALLLGIAAAMLISLPFGFVADRREADRVRERGRPAVGTVIAVDTWSQQPSGQVRVDTANGTATLVLQLEPDETTGAKTLDLRYDPDQPTRVWRAGAADPPGTSGWAAQVLFFLWLPLSLGLALWLRWHPPKAGNRAAS